MGVFDLDAARVEFPLPKGQADAVLNRSQLAVALNVSDNTITKYISRGMPVLTEGGNGREYEFQLSDCYAWRMSQDAEAQARKRAGDEAAAQLALLFRNDHEDGVSPSAGLTAEQIAAESDADYRRNRAAELRRELVRAHRVAELFEDVLVQFRTQITTLVDFAEIEFGLTPEQVTKLQARCDSALVSARAELGKVIAPGEVAAMPRGGVDAQEGLPV